VTIDALLSGPAGALAAALDGPSAGPVPAGARVAAPVGGQEVWAAGVTYTRSREARVAESGTPDPGWPTCTAALASWWPGCYARRSSRWVWCC